MKARALIECTIDTASPASELAAVISVVLSTIPEEAARLSILQALGDEIDRVLASLTVQASQTEASGEEAVGETRAEPKVSVQ